MALTVIYFCDSFDHYVTADVLKKWTSSTGGGGAAPTISAGNGRRSTASLRFGAAGTLTKTLASSVATISVGFGYKVSALPGSASIISAVRNSGTTHVDLRLNADGTFSLTRNGTVLGTSAVAIAAGTFYHIEYKAFVDNTTGTAELKLNESSILNLTNQDTQNGATTTVNQVMLQGITTSDHDDLIVADDFAGDKHVSALFPAADGAHSDFTISGSANHFENVNEASPNDDSDYNFSSTLNQIDTYDVQNAAAGEVITAVAVHLYAKKTDTGSRSIAPVIRHSVADNVGTNVNPSDTSYLYFSQIYMTNPGTAAAWDTTDFNAAEFGVKVTA